MHYCMLVFGDDVAAALEPFNENTVEVNPQGRWDWYAIGGRYLGRLLVKQPVLAVSGRPGTFDNPPHWPGGVDQARWGDLDWPEMRWLADAFARKSYAEWREDLAAGKDLIRWRLSGYLEEEILADPEKFILESSAPISCWGVVRNGVWTDKYRRVGGDVAPDDDAACKTYYERYYDTKPQLEWQVELSQLLADVQPEELVTMVDVHD